MAGVSEPPGGAEKPKKKNKGGGGNQGKHAGIAIYSETAWPLPGKGIFVPRPYS